MTWFEENVDLILIPKLYEEAANAVCECVSFADYLIQGANPDSGNLSEETLAGGFALLAHALIRAECDPACECRRWLRELYATPPKRLGDISGPSYNDMGLRFAERTFDGIQVAAGLRKWKIPIRGATKQHIQDRAEQIGQRAKVVLPQFWQSALNCPAQRLKDYIENEAAKGVKAWRNRRLKKRGKQG